MKTGKALLISWILALVVSACASKSPAPTQDSIAPGSIPLTEADVPRISAADAKAALDRGEAVIVDVRSVDSFAAGHIAGAVSIPLEKFETSLGSLSFEKDQWIITYCT